MTRAIHAPVISSARCLQHVLQKNAIALSGVVHQNMRYSAYKFTVLDNGTAAHGCVKIGTTFFEISFIWLALQSGFRGIPQIRIARPRNSTRYGCFCPVER